MREIGKQTAVQAAELTASPLHVTAARGIEGYGEALPHAEQIQRSFGRFDVSHLRAHVGGPAADASRALGGRAYAYGRHLAFVEAPDLHTAAHEAAHALQQQAGVTLARGIDEPGDWYEQHANAVADLVVRGESAEALLAGLRGGGGSASLGVVQRQSTPSPAAPVPAAPARKATWKDISRAARDSKTKAALDIDWIERRAARSRSVKKTHAIATRSGD